MTKIAINVATPIGYAISKAVSDILNAGEALANAQAAVGQMGGAAIDTTTPLGTALFGVNSGGSADAESALGTVNTALQTFLTTYAGALATLYQGNVS